MIKLEDKKLMLEKKRVHFASLKKKGGGQGAVSFMSSRKTNFPCIKAIREMQYLPFHLVNNNVKS